MRRSLWCLLLLACDGGGGTDAGAPPIDAGDPTPPICADAAGTFAFPSPVWIGADHLVVPESDRAGDAVRGLGWEPEVEAITGWPRRPTWIVPLDRPAGAIDASRVRIAVSGGGAFAALDVPVLVENPSPQTLVVTPRDPLPHDAVEVILGLEAGVAGDAHAIPICDAGAPHPDQLAAATALGVPVDVALRLTIARGADALVALQARLAATPVLVVESAEAAAVVDLVAPIAPSAEDAPRFAPMYLRGVLALPEYRRDGGPWQLDTDGAPTPSGTTRPAFIVVLPAAGTAPHPVVLFQHGGGQSPLDVFAVGAELAAEGFAFVAIDLPGHGNRAGPGGGGDLDFIDFDSPLTTRENFRQAAGDHLAVLHGLAALEASIEATLGVADALDETRRYYMGMSLGAVSGSLTTAASRGLVASALFVGGAGYPELMNHGLFALAATRVLRGSEPQPSTMLAVVETIGDGADPLAYAIAAEDRAAPPTPILFLQAVDDPLISHRASEQWARAFGASLARPIDHATVGLDEVDLPTLDNFSFAGSTTTATRVLVQNPMEEIEAGMRHGQLIRTDYMRAMVARCFVTARDDGSCEVIDTGFADR